MQATYRTGDMVTGAAFVARIVDAAEKADHHPDIDLRYGLVRLRVSTHSARRLTAADVDLANTIADIAAELRLGSLPTSPGRIDIAIDALNIDLIKPFWRAVLGYRDEPDHTLVDLTDPAGIGSPVWFQQMDAPRPQRSRIHVDLWVPHDLAEARISEALAAGGRLVTDEFAPEWWVLADAEGNEVCVCTWQGRAPDADDQTPGQ